jgi:hypothetical protein
MRVLSVTRTDISRADDNLARRRPPGLGERCPPTSRDMARPRPVRWPSPGEEFSIAGPASSWATPQQVPGQNAGLTALRRRDGYDAHAWGEAQRYDAASQRERPRHRNGAGGRGFPRPGAGVGLSPNCPDARPPERRRQPDALPIAPAGLPALARRSHLVLIQPNCFSGPWLAPVPTLRREVAPRIHVVFILRSSWARSLADTASLSDQ